MTIHATFPAATRTVAAPAVPAHVTGLSATQAAVFFDAKAGALPLGARLSLVIDGWPMSGPVLTTRLLRQNGDERHAVLIAGSASDLCRASVAIEAAGAVVARIDPLALQSPLVDPMALLGGLDRSGALRLLKLILTTGASLFGKGDLGGFGKLVGQLVESLAAPVPLAAWCPVGQSAAVLSWRLPGGLDLSAPRDLCVVHQGRARRFTDFVATIETAGNERLLHLMASRPLPEGADLIVLGAEPVRLAGPGRAAARGFPGWLDRRDAGTRSRALAWIDTVAGTDRQVAALRDELTCPDGAAPALEILHLSETPEGLLYLLAVADARGLLSALRISTGGQSHDVPCDALSWHPVHGTVAFGFVPTAGRTGGVAGIAPVYRSGRVGAPVAARPAPFDGRVPEALAALPDEIVAPALARALPAAMRVRPKWRHRMTTFGAIPAAPRMALIVSVAGAPEYLHTVVNALVAEPGGRRVELVVCHTDGAVTDLVCRTARALSAVHRLGIRVVSVAAEAFASERVRTAIAEAAAPAVLVLGPDTLPAERGWLATWRRRVGTGHDPRVVLPPTTLCDGTPCRDRHTIGLNPGAVARLRSGRALLPGIDADLAMLPDLKRRKATAPVFRTYASAPVATPIRAAERCAVAAAREGR